MQNRLSRSFLLCLGILTLISCREVITPQKERSTFDEALRFNAVTVLPEDRILLGGGRRFEERSLFLSRDGGEFWEPTLTFPEFNQIIFDIDFHGRGKVFASGLGGKILQTRNRQVWETRQLNVWLPMHAVEAVNDTLIIAVGGDGYDQGVIQRSATQGGIWEMVDTLDHELRDVAFTDGNTGYACGFGVVLKTEDGGLHWDYTDIKGDFFVGIDFPTPDTGYVIGRAGSIYQTIDAGQTWDRLRNGNALFNAPDAYNALVFQDVDHGFIVGDKGLILETLDGGQSWKRWETDIQAHLQDVAILNNQQIIVVGDEGTYLELTP